MRAMTRTTAAVRKNFRRLLPAVLAAAALLWLVYAILSSAGELQARVVAQSGCVNSLGAISGTQTISGQWASSCLSTRPTLAGSGDRYARFYTFTLYQSSEITIELTSTLSGDTDGMENDPYLYVSQGHEKSGTVVAENDDREANVNLNSRIVNTLAAGDYTIEATSYKLEQTGGIFTQDRCTRDPDAHVHAHGDDTSGLRGAVPRDGDGHGEQQRQLEQRL